MVPQGGPFDLTEEPAGSVGPAGAVRLMRQGGVLVASVGGAAARPIPSLAAAAASVAVTQTYISEEIDFASLASTGIIIVPAASGFLANIVNFKIRLTAVGGALGAAGTIKAGNDVGLTNFLGASGAGMNSSTIATPFANGANTWTQFVTTSGIAIPSLDLATPITLSVTVANNGAAVVLRGRAYTTYSLVAV